MAGDSWKQRPLKAKIENQKEFVMKIILAAAVALAALASTAQAFPKDIPSFDGPQFLPVPSFDGPQFVPAPSFDGPQFGTKDLITADGPALLPDRTHFR
jgi:hypothetical protein